MADFVIGSFNCRWGAFRNDKRKEDADREKNEKINAIIKKNNLQILALQEYCVEKGLDEKVSNSLLSTLAPPRWHIDGYPPNMKKRDGVEYAKEKTDEFTEAISPKQVNNGYAILWNTNDFERKDSGRWKNYSDRIRHRINQRGRIIRYPQIIRLQPIHLPKFEIRIINIHLTYSGIGKTYYIRKKDMEKLNEMPMSYGQLWHFKSIRISEMIAKRKEELDLCLNIYNDVDSYSEDGITPYTILLGDFNLEPGNCRNILDRRKDIGRRNKKREYILKMEEETTLHKKLCSKPYYHKYDHFVTDQNSGGLEDDERIDTLKYFDFKGNNEMHYRELSDHVPIKMNISLNPRRL